MGMTEEEKKVRSERMKAWHAAKKLEKVEAPLEEVKETVSLEDYNSLKSQIEELKGMFAQQPQVQQVVAQPIVQGGRLVGRTDKFIVDPAHYPSPVDRLKGELRLQRFAFEVNYDVTFAVTSTSYQTLDGVNMREPRFTLELHKVVIDEDTGEPTTGRYVIARCIFHEDPEAAMVIARENGIEVDDSNEKVFLDEMRYLRARDWLLGIFYPKAATSGSGRNEVVIGNKLVEFFTTNGETAQSPFAKMNGDTRKL